MKAKLFVFDPMNTNPTTDAQRVEREINDFLATDPEIAAVEHGPDAIIFLYNDKEKN